MALYGCNHLTAITGEQLALSDFASRLSSCNYSTDPGIGDDDGTTRQEAKLLMSLLATIPKLDPDELDSDSSYISDSSTSRRDVFSFTCPSLSLERTKAFSCSAVYSSPGSKRPAAHRVSEDEDEQGEDSEVPPPAVLLRRPLKVDDRDALRLSADAMARNVFQSYHKAIQWRIRVWIATLSKALMAKEKEMLLQGAGETELKELLFEREARLILALQEVAKRISVSGSKTSFRVLPQRLQDDEVSPLEPSCKKRRSETSIEENDNYNYSVKHSILLECVITLQTPAGFSEIALEVPGTMEGTFVCGEPGKEELTSVVVDLDTDMLAVMIEKSVRQVVRISVETLIELAASAFSEECTPSTEEKVFSPRKATTESDNASSPTPGRNCNKTKSPGSDFAAIVTPQPRSSSLFKRNQLKPKNSVIMPIPDDFDDKNATTPRRISPQPGSSASQAFFTPHTPMKSSHRSDGLALVSPPPRDSQDYYEVPENGPSLPVLVEVACRAMQAN